MRASQVFVLPFSQVHRACRTALKTDSVACFPIGVCNPAKVSPGASSGQATTMQSVPVPTIFPPSASNAAVRAIVAMDTVSSIAPSDKGRETATRMLMVPTAVAAAQSVSRPDSSSSEPLVSPSVTSASTRTPPPTECAGWLNNTSRAVINPTAPRRPCPARRRSNISKGLTPGEKSASLTCNHATVSALTVPGRLSDQLITRWGVAKRAMSHGGRHSVSKRWFMAWLSHFRGLARCRLSSWHPSGSEGKCTHDAGRARVHGPAVHAENVWSRTNTPRWKTLLPPGDSRWVRRKADIGWDQSYVCVRKIAAPGVDPVRPAEAGRQVVHVSCRVIPVGGGQTALNLRGKSPVGGGNKKRLPLTRERRRAADNNSSLPSSGRWRDRCLRHLTQDLMSANKQVFWLRVRPTPPALPSKRTVA
jgi:hypothetical protein